MKKNILNTISVFLGISIFILSFYFTFMPCALNRNTYYKLYDNESFQIYYRTENNRLNYSSTLPKDQIKTSLDKTLKYMLSKVDTPQTTITFSDGKIANFYTEGEISHLKDCQNLFSAFQIFCLIVGIITIFLSIGIFYLKKEFTYKTIKYFFIGIFLSIAIILVVGVYGLIDFDHAFVIFHKIFFPHGNWTFISSSYMIQMLPENEIFKTLAYNIIISFLIVMILISSALIVLYYYLKKKQLKN